LRPGTSSRKILTVAWLFFRTWVEKDAQIISVRSQQIFAAENQKFRQQTLFGFLQYGLSNSVGTDRILGF
jgi:hypothetical protein